MGDGGAIHVERPAVGHGQPVEVFPVPAGHHLLRRQAGTAVFPGGEANPLPGPRRPGLGAIVEPLAPSRAGQAFLAGRLLVGAALPGRNANGLRREDESCRPGGLYAP